MLQNPEQNQNIPDSIDSEARVQLRAKLKDPNYLPTFAEINYAFGVGLETQQDSSGISYQPQGLQKFNDFCWDRENPVFEFLNKEYVASLAKYIADELSSLGPPNELGEYTVIDYEAGNGRLAHFLQIELDNIFQESPTKIKVIPLDSQVWQLKQHFPVAKLEGDLSDYDPDLVICSWMPDGVDFSKLFRSVPRVKEYVLIGEADGGCCGDSWETWGQSSFEFDKTGKEIITHQGEVEPFKREGFERIDLKKLKKFQVCCTDEPGLYWHSHTVSFRRLQ